MHSYRCCQGRIKVVKGTAVEQQASWHLLRGIVIVAGRCLPTFDVHLKAL